MVRRRRRQGSAVAVWRDAGGCAPPSQALYKRVCDYLEMDDRVELLNKRFGVLQVPIPPTNPSP